MARPPLSHTEAERAATLRRVRWGVIVGSALEWYDFYLYAAMAALVFGRVFFPDTDPALATLASYATFAVGFICRPLGGILLGDLGDRIGRRRVLTLTFVLMGVATVAIGLIPPHSSIGVLAPILLIVCRMLQGVGAGSEASTAAVLSFEHAHRTRRGSQTAWPALGTAIGLLASSLTMTAVAALPEDVLLGWAWRIPFLASAVLIVLGFWVRRLMPEPPEFITLARADPEPAATRVRTLIGGHWRGLVTVMVLTVGYVGLSYTFKTFSLTYLQDVVGVAASVGTFGVALASAVALAVIPLAGRLTDHLGPRPIIVAASATTILYAFPFFWLLDTGTTIAIWIALIVASGLIVPALLAASSSYMTAQFPMRVRAAGLGSAREIAAAVAGGLIPMAAVALVTLDDSHPTWGVSLIFVVSAVAIVGSCLTDQSRQTTAEPAPEGFDIGVAAGDPVRRSS